MRLFGLLVSLLVSTSMLASSFQINNYKVFSPDEEVVVNFYNNNYYRNKQSFKVHFTLYKVNNVEDFFKSNMLGSYGNVVSDSLIKQYKQIKTWWHTSIHNRYSDVINMEELETGVYVLEGMSGTDIAQIPIIVSDYSLVVNKSKHELVSFLTNSQTGKKVKAYKAMIKVGNETLVPQYYKNASALFNVQELKQNYYNIPVVAFKDGQACVTGAYFYNYYDQSGDTKAYIFTDRSAYRPEQTVYFKGIFRKKEGFKYSVLSDSITYSIYNHQHEEILTKRVALDKNGTFSDSAVADASWKLGDYTIKYSASGPINYWYGYNQNTNTCKFKIEEYKKPEFEVKVDLNKSQYQSGDLIEGEIKADYFFGAPVVNAQVTYKIVKQHFYIPWYFNYRYWSWYADFYGEDYNVYGQQIVHSETVKLDENGVAKFSYQTDDKTNNNYKYSVIAEVMDASRRTISGSNGSIVAYSSFTLSANPSRYYFSTEDRPRIDISALDFSRNLLEETVRVQVYDQGRYRRFARKTNEPASVVFDTTVVTSKLRSIELFLPKMKPGNYSVKLESNDEKDRQTQTSIYFYVIDQENARNAWWASQGSIEIMPDKKVYNAGETINAMVYVPEDVDALISIGGNAFVHFDTYAFKGDDSNQAYQQLQIPLDESVYGQLKIQVAFMKEGRYVQSESQVAIIPDNRYLDVSLEFDESEYKPGSTASAIIKVKDHLGNPVPNANVTLSTADEAIYSLYPDQIKSIEDVFYGNNPYAYNYNSTPNQFSNYSQSTIRSLKQVEWRRQQYDIAVSDLNLLDNRKSYKHSYHASKGKVTIRGYVIDKKTGAGISNATVYIGKKRFQTDANGYYAISGFKLSHTSLEFKHNGARYSILNLPLYDNTDVDLIVAINPRKDEEVTFSDNPEVVRLGENRQSNTVITGGTPADLDDLESEDLVEVANVESNRDQAGMSLGSLSKNQRSLANAPAMASTIQQKALSGKKDKSKEQSPGNATVAPEKIRSDFKDAIYWNPNINTNSKGEAVVKIKLPDNLTTWRTVAKVITLDSKVGETIAKTIVTKNLLVRMETPRFINLGDELLIATTVHNYLNTSKKVTIELQSDGLSVHGTRRTIKVDPLDDVSVDWKINTQMITTANLTVKALTDEESDAMKVDVPVQPYGLEMITAKSLYLNNGDKQSMTLHIPEDIDLNSATIDLSTAPSVTSSLLNSLDDLIGYPYGCVEQTMSRFLPNIIVSNTLSDLGKDYASTIDHAELTKMVAQGTDRLGQLQHSDGGWGWWENDETNPFMTAYVVNGLHMASKAGYPVPSDMYDRGLRNLLQIIRNKKMDNNTTYAYCMMVASKAGEKSIWKKKSIPDDVNAYELALWAQAAHYQSDKDLASRMVERLEDKAIKTGSSTHWGGKKFYYNWQDDQVETTANVVLALSMIDENHALIPNAVKWLMDQKKGSSWHNTRQTAMTIFGLSKLLKRDLNPNMELQIFVNGSHLANLNYTSKNVHQAGASFKLKAAELFSSLNNGKTDKTNVLQKGTNTIEVRQTGKGSLFVNGKLSYFLHGDSKAAKTEMENMSFNITRDYYKLVKVQKKDRIIYEKKAIDKETIQPGDDILVKVKINSKSSQQYVLIEDPIPAGCEFIQNPLGYVIEGEPIYNGSGRHWDYNYWGYWNWNRWYSHREYRDDKLAHTITNLSSGNYEYTYLMKAQIPGTFQVNPVVAQLMYYPENRGFSPFTVFEIQE